MFAILNKSIGLRSWQRVPYAYISAYSSIPQKLNRREFEILIKADGKTDIPYSETAKVLLESGLMCECKEGEGQLSKWQCYQNHDNRLVPGMNLQITGRCNYNCLHCFNAGDHHALQAHMTLEQAVNVLDQAAACGIRTITITGGEPMVHQQLREIISAIYERDMKIHDFNTNGHFITQAFLDFLKSFSIPAMMTMKISFDGLGYHDEMRQYKGSEEKALKAMELCIKNGFPVMAQVNVNENNMDTIPETMELLDAMKVGTIRLIRTTEVPRWIKNGGRCLNIKDYYDSMLEVIKKFISKPRYSDVILWQVLQIQTRAKTYSMDAVKHLRMNQPICKGNRGMVAVGANGNVYPCLQMSGIIDDTGKSFGNIFKIPLKEILQTDSQYMQSVCMSVEEKAAINGKCQNCPYLKYCGTGCPAMSVAKVYEEERRFCLTEPDTWKCTFFNFAYYEKVLELMKGFTCLSPQPVFK